MIKLPINLRTLYCMSLFFLFWNNNLISQSNDGKVYEEGDTITTCIWLEYSLGFYAEGGTYSQPANFVAYSDCSIISKDNYLEGYFIAQRQDLETNGFPVEVFNSVDWVANETMVAKNIRRDPELLIVNIKDKWLYGLFRASFVVKGEIEKIHIIPDFTAKGGLRKYETLTLPTYLINLISLDPVIECSNPQ